MIDRQVGRRDSRQAGRQAGRRAHATTPTPTPATAPPALRTPGTPPPPPPTNLSFEPCHVGLQVGPHVGRLVILDVHLYVPPGRTLVQEVAGVQGFIRATGVVAGRVKPGPRCLQTGVEGKGDQGEGVGAVTGSKCNNYVDLKRDLKKLLKNVASDVLRNR